MSPGDARAYYAALGIELPAWSQREAPVRCFAQPDAHNRDDRSPSCSVNLASGAWNCHGCSAHGGAYDAAIARGHSPRSAMELLIAHRLAEPREADHRVKRTALTRRVETAAPAESIATPLTADDDNVRYWADGLEDNGRLRAGRRAAEQIHASLRAAAVTSEIVDLWPDRDDGYDLTDRIVERKRERPGRLTAAAVASLLAPAPPVHRKRPRARASVTQDVAR